MIALDRASKMTHATILMPNNGICLGLGLGGGSEEEMICSSDVGATVGRFMVHAHQMEEM